MLRHESALTYPSASELRVLHLPSKAIMPETEKTTFLKQLIVRLTPDVIEYFDLKFLRSPKE
jgi:hypothetical protein